MDFRQALEKAGATVPGSADQQTVSCPWHEDDSPSLSIHLSKGVYNCHSCGAKGNFYQLLTEKLDYTKREAMQTIDDRPAKSPASTIPKPQKQQRPQPLPKSAIAQYIYRDQDEKLSLVVCRFNRKPKFLPFKPVGDGLFLPGKPPKPPLYRLPQLLKHTDAAVPVFITEGEKCADIVAASWQGVTVVTWQGGAKNWSHQDWAPLAGKKALLLADHDAPGLQCMTDLAIHLTATLGCKVAISHDPSQKRGFDIYDAIKKWGPADAQDWVMTHIKPFSTKQTKKKGAFRETIFSDNDFFKVLGMNRDGLIGFYRKPVSIIKWTRGTRLMSPCELLEIASFSFWKDVFHSDSDTDLKPKEALRIGEHLVRIAEARGLFEESALRGRGAIVDSHKRIWWNLGDRCLTPDGTERRLSDSNSEYVMTPGSPIAFSSEPDDLATAAEKKEMATALIGYRFQDTRHAKAFAGWCVSALIGGALEWRGHGWLVSPAESGKSWLLKNVVEKIFGARFFYKFVSASEAALARAAASDSLPIIMDELEPGASGFDGILSMCRFAAGGEGKRARASQGDTSINTWEPRFSALFVSTKSLDMKKADESRFCLFELGKAVRDWPKVSKRLLASLNGNFPQRLRNSIIKDTPSLVASAYRAKDRLELTGLSSRRAMIFGGITAGWQYLSGTDELLKEHSDRSAIDDAPDALVTLLSLMVRLPGEKGPIDITVSECLEQVDDFIPNAEGTAAARLGFRISQKDQLLYIATKHRPLQDKLRLTPLAGIDLHKLLRQMDGVESVQVQMRFAAHSQRATVVTKQALEHAGFSGILTRDGLPRT